MMTRHMRLIASALLAVAAFASTASADERPNILFVFTDDHAFQAIGAYGSRINQTPAIDRLAREGMTFDRCYVTNSICGPCRAVIQTGKYSHINGFYQNGNVFNGLQPTFPKMLRQAGYQTAIIGKWHLESMPQGYDHYEILIGQGPYWNPPMIRNGVRVSHTGYTTHIITELAMKWLKEQRDPSKPFMLMYQHKAPHREWQPGPGYFDKYDDVNIPEPSTLFDDYAGRAKPARTQDMTIRDTLSPLDLKFRPPGNLTPEQLKMWHDAYDAKNKQFEESNLTGDDLVRWKYQRYIKDYLRCIAAVDDDLGKVLAYLDESGLSKNTVVIYSSDQGFYLGEHGWFDKRWMYEESLRTPLIVRWPGVVKPGVRNKDIVSNLDFAETFLDIAGVPVPADMQGRSIVPILKGQTPADWRKSFYYHYYEYPAVHSVRKHYGVTDGRYKLIHYYEPDVDEWELFDLQEDPQEMRSVYTEPGYAPIVERMKAELKRLQEKYGDTNPTQDPIGADQVYQKQIARGVGLSLVAKLANATEQPKVSIEPQSKPLTVGAWCTPSANDGVVIAQGGASLGYALFIKDGVAHFGVRNRDMYRQTAGGPKLEPGKRVHLAGTIDADAKLHLYINGDKAAEADGYIIAAKPADGLSLGADTGSLVGPYGADNAFKGELTDLRIYYGVLDEAGLKQWAGK